VAVAAQWSKARRCGSAPANPTQHSLAKNIYVSKVLTKTYARSRLEWRQGNSDVRRRWRLRWREPRKMATFRGGYTCAERINASMSISMIINTKNEHKMEWGDFVVLWPCSHDGASGQNQRRRWRATNCDGVGLLKWA
jgi:hypothetical protein